MPEEPPEQSMFEPEPARFEAETPPDGAALLLEGEPTEDGLMLRIRGRSLGPIFGLATTLTFDPRHLAVADAHLEPAALGPSGEVAEFLAVERDRIAFGIARRGPALGDRALGSDRIATVRFTAGEGESVLALSRTMVRRADESFISVSVAPARFHGGSR